MFGQSQKNDLNLGVSVLPLIGSSEDFTSGFNGLVIKPSIGYHISNRTSINLNFSYATMNNIIIDDNINSHYNSFAFTPSVRNNFVNKKSLRVFAEFGLGFGTIKYNPDNQDLKTFSHEVLSGGISIINIGIGGNYYFNENFGLEVIIPYIITNNITSDRVNNTYSGIGPTIGFTYKLN